MEPPKSFKLWEAFQNAKCLHFNSPKTICKTERRSCSSTVTLLHQIFTHCNPVRTVYAGESDKQETVTESLGKTQPTAETTIERLGKTRPTVLITDEEICEYLENETGKQRLQELFEVGEDKKLTADLDMTFSSIKFCAVTVFMVTSVFGALAARETFLKKHQHTKFETKFKAHRSYNDAIILGGAKFGMKWAFKVGAFSSILLLTAQSIAVYRNKTSVWEYIAGGSLTGAILRLNLGLKGVVAGGLIGATLGAIGGSCIYLLMTASNETQELRHYWQVQKKLQQKKQLEEEFARPPSLKVTVPPHAAITQPS